MSRKFAVKYDDTVGKEVKQIVKYICKPSNPLFTRTKKEETLIYYKNLL